MNRALCVSDSQKTLCFQKVILLYFAIFSVGLCKLCWVFSQYVYQHIDIQDVVDQMCDWVAVFPHAKLPQLLFFGLSLIAMFGFWGLYFALTMVNSARHSLKLSKPHGIFGCLFVSLLINLGLVTMVNSLYLDALVWIIGFFALLMVFYNKKIGLYSRWDRVVLSGTKNRISKVSLKSTCDRNGGRSQKIVSAIVHLESKFGLNPIMVWGITAFITLGFICIFYPLIFKPIQIANEFMDSPEQTLLRSGQIVDNTQYINQHRISGLHLYDPRHDQGVLPVSAEYAQVVLRSAPGLVQFLNRQPGQFAYDAATQTLSLKGKLTQRDYSELLEVYQADKDSQQQIESLVIQANQIESSYKSRIYMPEEREFIAKNRSENERKVKAGWLFFHHSWVLNPILALSKGADANKQVFIYGYGSAVFLKQMLTQMGAVSFQNYFKATFVFYPMYFLIFLAGIYALFRSVELVCIGAILLTVSFLLLGYQMILLAPGYNPMRHLFDMLMLVLFSQYVKKNNLPYLLLLVFTGFVAIVWSKDFGLFLTASCLGTVIIKSIVMPRRDFVRVIVACLGAVGAILLYGASFHGVNYNFWHMLLGYTQPMMSTFRISIILVAISFGYLFYIQCKKMDSVYFWLALCVFFYLQCQLLYYVWYPSVQHLLVLAPMVIVGGMASVQLLGNKNNPNMAGIQTALIASVLFIYLPSMYFFYKEKMQYDAIFATHVVHDWKFQYASFQTTMEPQLLTETLDLIERYAPNSSIYLISKYDDILPVLTQRSNALPVVNLALDLLSKRDIERCKQAVRTNNPVYIFVDSDIHRDLRGDVMLFYDPACLNNDYQLSYGRFTAIKNMRTLYDEIQEDYRLIEKGSLLSVYQRKQGA